MNPTTGPDDLRRWHRLFGPLLALLAALTLAAAASVTASAEEQPADEDEREGQVVGGKAVRNGAYPFMVSLQNDRRGTTPREDHFCGGTLINSQHILTAAHCAVRIKDGTYPVRQLRVVVGRTKLNSRQGQVREVRQSSHVRIHPRYRDGRSYAYDVAVIRLDRPVRGVRTVRLAGARQNGLERPGSRRVVAGWGLTREPGFFSSGSTQDRMRAATPPVVSDRRAGSAYGSNYVSPLMVAAGKKGVDTCQGDSGGPIFLRMGRGFTQFGVTSFGNGCARDGYPGVYTELNAPAVGNWVRNASR